MSDLNEKLAKLNEVAAADEAFGKELRAALEMRNIDEIIRVAAEKGIEFSADDFYSEDLEGKEVDESELEAVAGGGLLKRADELRDKCRMLGAVTCGAGFGVALWSPGI